MVSKKRRSVSLDEHVAEEIEDDSAEFSPLVNKWAEDYYHEGKRPIMQEQRVEEMIDEIDRREAELDEMYEATKEMFSCHRETLRESLGEAAEEEQLEKVYKEMTDWKPHTLSSVDGFENQGVPRDPENPAIRHRAKRLGLSPEDLVDELRKRDRRDGFVTVEGD